VYRVQRNEDQTDPELHRYSFGHARVLDISERLMSHAGSAAATAPQRAARPPRRPRSADGVRAAGHLRPLRSTSFHHVDQHMVARRSAFADSSTLCVTIDSRLAIVRRRPSIVTTTVSFSASANRRGRLYAQGPTGVAKPPLLKSGAQRGPTRAHLVTALAVRHRAPALRIGSLRL
jgi:hypothetical protein